MGLITEWVRFGSKENYSGYFVKPDRDDSALPAVIVLQEIWGVDAHIQDVTRRFAQAGYAAFAPELFGQKGSYKAGLDPDSVLLLRRFMEELPHGYWQDPAKREEALSAYTENERVSIQMTRKQMFDPATRATFIDAVLAASHWLRNERPETKGSRIGAVGFCMGGMLSALLASRDSSLNAAVIFYGMPIQKEQLSSIECPVLGHYGGLDPAITDKVPEFEAAMKELGKTIEVHVYPETPHAFFNDGSPTYRIKAARESFARTISFFAKFLV